MIGTKILEERESKYNGHLRVVKSIGLGTYIQAEGLTQSGGIVETIWKSTLKRIHKSLATNHKTLILGLGGGTVAKLIRKIWPDAKITGVDIDPVMVELGKKYLGLERANVEIKIADALSFLTIHQSLFTNHFTNHFDLVIIDLYNGDQFPEKFGELGFLNKLKGSLLKNGVAVFNRTYYGDMRPKAVKFGLKLQKVFRSVKYYYPEANLMLICYAREANI